MLLASTAYRSLTNANNAPHIRLGINPPVRLTDLDPAPCHTVIQAGLQRFIRLVKDQEIAQRVITPISRSGRTPRGPGATAAAGPPLHS